MCVHKAFKFNVDKAIGTFINAKKRPLISITIDMQLGKCQLKFMNIFVYGFDMKPCNCGVSVMIKKVIDIEIQLLVLFTCMQNTWPECGYGCSV